MNGKKIATSISILAAFIFTGCSTRPTRPQMTIAATNHLRYTYAQLEMVDMDQFKNLVYRRIHQGEHIEDQANGNSADAITYFTDALRIVLSRPDQDGARNLFYIEVVKRLEDLRATNSVLNQLADEGIGNIESSQNSPVVRATYVYLLINMIAELKPTTQDNPDAKKVIQKIANAGLQIPDNVNQAVLMRSMSPLESPSAIAAKVLGLKK